jgi:hypothetical protein
VEIHLVVALEQAAEEQAIDALGLRIGGKAWVEIGGLDSMRKVSEERSLREECEQETRQKEIRT